MPDEGLVQIEEARSEADGRRDWALKAKRYIKRELKYKDVTYEELARRLRTMGIEETPGSISMKIARGLYPTWFFFAVMRAIGAEEMRFRDLG
jgi:hypothetical protein